MNDQPSFSVKTAAATSGLTIFMVDYLARSGIVVPSVRSKAGRGKPRLYAFGDLVALKTAASLLKGGIEARKLKASLAVLQKKYGKTLTTAPASYFCTDGQRVMFKSADNLYADLSKSGQFVFQFVVDLASVQNHIEKKLKAATKESRAVRGAK